MDSQEVQEVDEPENSMHLGRSASNSALEPADEEEPGSDGSSDWIIEDGLEPESGWSSDLVAEDGSDTQSRIMSLEYSTTQDDDEDQWFCTLCDKCKSLIKDAVEFYFVDQIREYKQMPSRWWHNINYLQKTHHKCDLCTLVMAHMTRTLSHQNRLRVLELSGPELPSLEQLSDRNSTLAASCSDKELIFQYSQSDSSSLPPPTPGYYSEGMLRVASMKLCEILNQASDPDWLCQFQLSSSRTDSHETVQKLARWLRNCSAHGTCTQWCSSVSTSRSTPSRLLEIDPDSSCCDVRLVIMKDRAVEECSYATLSHCWGAQVFPRLLSHNFEQMIRRIKFNDLPPTFQDAIWVAQKLGFRYLWIDALCIIQDSPEDWLTQSRAMADVYANCSLNISAAASSDSKGGLFRSRSAPDFSSLLVCVSSRTIVFYRDTWRSDVANSPLAARGWVVQERFLAPRVVHFGHRQVHWDCLELSTSESLPDSFALSDLHERDSSKQISSEKAHGQESFRRTIYALWDRKIRKYSYSQFTRPSDRPVALLGLSHGFAKLLGLPQDNCVFGMWRTRFACELMWHTSVYLTNEGMFCQERIGNIPTWSWCSVTGGIENPCWKTVPTNIPSHDIRNEIVSILQLRGLNRNGLSSASEHRTITLSGPMCEATVDPIDLRHFVVTLRCNLPGEHMTVEINWDDRRESEIERLTKSKLYLLLRAIERAMEWHGQLHYHQTPSFIEAIEAGSDSFDDDESGDISSRATVRGASMYLCLLLQPTDVPAHFERVGYIEVGKETAKDFYKHSYEHNLAQWLRARDILDKAFQSRNLPSHLHEGMDEYGRYKINLV